MKYTRIEEQTLKMSNYGKDYGSGRGHLGSRGHARGRQTKEYVEWFKCHNLGHS